MRAAVAKLAFVPVLLVSSSHVLLLPRYCMSLEPLQALASDGLDRRASASLLHALHEFSITTGVGSSVYVKGHDVVLS